MQTWSQRPGLSICGKLHTASTLRQSPTSHVFPLRLLFWFCLTWTCWPSVLACTDWYFQAETGTIAWLQCPRGPFSCSFGQEKQLLIQACWVPVVVTARWLMRSNAISSHCTACGAERAGSTCGITTTAGCREQAIVLKGAALACSAFLIKNLASQFGQEHWLQLSKTTSYWCLRPGTDNPGTTVQPIWLAEDSKPPPPPLL